MNDAERDYLGKLLREAARKDRGYASFFDWPDRDQKELGIVIGLFQSLAENEHAGYLHLRPRGQGNDPPDCEASDPSGRLIGIEVTELVDGVAIHKSKTDPYFVADWDRDKFIEYLRQRVQVKDAPADLKGGPYHAYWLVVHCDEPDLSPARVEAFLSEMHAVRTRLIDQAFFLGSYVVGKSSYPYFRIPIAKAA